MHSSLMSNICHLLLVMCHLSIILVSDDLFETMFSTNNDALLDDVCNHLFDIDCNIYF